MLPAACSDDTAATPLQLAWQRSFAWLLWCDSCAPLLRTRGAAAGSAPRVRPAPLPPPTHPHVPPTCRRGLISSVGLMPITFILPPVMWIRARRPRGAELALNLVIAGSCSVIAALSLVGSARNIAVLVAGSEVWAGR